MSPLIHLFCLLASIFRLWSSPLSWLFLKEDKCYFTSSFLISSPCLITSDSSCFNSVSFEYIQWRPFVCRPEWLPNNVVWKQTSPTSYLYKSFTIYKDWSLLVYFTFAFLKLFSIIIAKALEMALFFFFRKPHQKQTIHSAKACGFCGKELGNREHFPSAIIIIREEIMVIWFSKAQRSPRCFIFKIVRNT